MGKFKTITGPSEGLYKEKGSKHFGYAYPIKSVEEVKPLIEGLKKEHHKARHWCFAYSIGVDDPIQQSSDDGEPSGTAGKPILNQILSFEVTNILIVVVRYFGGTKLGTAGLIRSYKTAAEEALKVADIIDKEELNVVKITFTYEDTSLVNQLINQHQIEIIKQQFELDCQYELALPDERREFLLQQIEELRCCKIEDLGYRAI